MRVYRDHDADLTLLQDRQIAVIGYGNQGRAQALNLRDSGLHVLVGNREDEYAARARKDGFTPLPIARAAAEGDVVALLIPDEVMPEVYKTEIAPYLSEGNALVFASGYNVAFGQLAPPPAVDVILVTPRMIGAGVRDLYVAGRHSGPILMGGAGSPPLSASPRTARAWPGASARRGRASSRSPFARRPSWTSLPSSALARPLATC